MNQWQKFRVFGIGFMALTCSFVIWVALRDNIQTWQVIVASVLALIALVITLFNRRLEKQFKKSSATKVDDAKTSDN